MKSKKLLISLAVVAVVIVIVVVMIAIFAVDDVIVRYHDFDGREIVATEGDGIVPNEILKLIKGNSTVFLSKSDLINKLNENWREWHAFAVVKKFPNTVEVHFVRRTAIAKMSVGARDVYIDSFGYVTDAVDGNLIDISSAFPEGVEAMSQNPEAGAPLTFKDVANDVRLKCVLEAILATWRCKVEVENIPQILGYENVFAFDDDKNLIITPKQNGAIIKVIAPETNLSDRLIKAYGVYYNDSTKLNDGDVITVHKNGSITTPGKK